MTHWDMLNKATKFEFSLYNMSQCVIEKERGIFDITARPTSKRLSLVFALLVGIHRCRLSLFFAQLQIISKYRFGKFCIFTEKFKKLGKPDKIPLGQVLLNKVGF